MVENFILDRTPSAILNNLNILRKTGLIIYGGGKIAIHIIETCKREDIKIYDVWDINAEKLKVCNGLNITKPNFNKYNIFQKKDIPVLVTIFSENGCKDIKFELESIGFENVFINRDFINGLCLHKCSLQVSDNTFKFDISVCHSCPVQKDEILGCNIFTKEVYGKTNNLYDFKKIKSNFTIRSMGVLITSKCNLTCVGCNHLRDHYKKSDNVDMDIDLVIADVKKVSQTVSFIKTLVLVGGEAFLHPKVDKVIEEILKINNIGVLQIITNGTVEKNLNKLVPLLKNDRVMVEISGYGDSISKHLQIKRTKFIEQLKEQNINHRYVESLMWTDFGGFEKRNYSENQIEDIYNACCFVSNDLLDGKLFKCSRSAYGTRIGKIPNYRRDYVDIRKLNGSELLKGLKDYFNDTKPRVCNHCNGALAPSLKAGVQVQKNKA